jgi:opacity protein-like surface antigen
MLEKKYMKMKLTAMYVSVAMLSSGAALGLNLDPKVYVGAEAQYNKLKSANGSEFMGTNGKSMISKDKLPGGSLQAGVRLTENFGAEFGVAVFKNSVSNLAAGNGNVKTKLKTPFVDVLGYLPVAGNINLIGSLGLGRLDTKINITRNGVAVPLTQAQQDAAKAKVGARAGLGAEYLFDANLGARAMVRYQKGNKAVKSVQSMSLGLFYQF